MLGYAGSEVAKSSALARAVAFCFAKQGRLNPLLLQRQSHFASQNKGGLYEIKRKNKI